MENDKETPIAPADNFPALDLFQMQDPAPIFRPARARRQWMDRFVDRHPYRCLPLTMANSTGWELLCPFDVEIEWNGGPLAVDITISSPDPQAHITGFAQSHFQRGIITFHTGYLFRTPPGWAVWCGGPPNWPKDGVYPLSGLVETDWLPFPFTMNWQMTRAGRVTFKKDEPFCFITLSEHRRLDRVQPHLRSLNQDSQMARDYAAWRESRTDFMTRLEARDAGAISEGWQRHYMRGIPPSAERIAKDHDTKRRLQPAQDLRGGGVKSS